MFMFCLIFLDVIGEVVSCGAIDYPIIEGNPVKQLRFELQDTM